MNHLKDSQLQQLKDALTSRLHAKAANNIEFLDHLASLIEAKCSLGKPFERALTEVMSNFSDEELHAFERASFDRQWHHKIFRKDTRQIGLMVGIALCIWIFIEYLFGSLFGIPELGAMYGLLSEVILGVGIWHAVSKLEKHGLSSTPDFRKTMTQAMKVSAIAANVVFIFMLPYVGFLNTELYGLHEGGNPMDNNIVPFSIIVMTGIGVMFEGLIMGLIVALIRSRWQRLVPSTG